MNKLSFVEGEYARDLIRLVHPIRHKTRAASLRRARKAAVDQANAYRQFQPRDRLLSSHISKRAKKAFLYYWDKPPVAVKSIRARVFGTLLPRSEGRCPYCSLAGPVRSIDHFLEKHIVPELALYDRNLVPSCRDCNSDRLHSFDQNGEQQVLHLYDDDVDAIPDVLMAEVTLQNGIPRARFFVPTPVPAEAELYARHFCSLRLEAAYRGWAAAAMRDLVRTDELVTVDTGRWPKCLISTADRLQAFWGNNEPKVALLRALALRIDVIKVLLRP